MQINPGNPVEWSGSIINCMSLLIDKRLLEVFDAERFIWKTGK
jgi:hypothetical protein